ncbi:glycerophosphodiester phosphodiesterase family protein [Glycocaulis sp.]
MRTMGIIAAAILAAITLIYLHNASWRVPPGESDVYFIAHRGVHQTIDADGLGRDDCSADRISPPEHAFLENTLPSIEAAFGHGATIVEIDIHPTTDGDFAIFHDWTLDCRTDGTGVTRQRSMEYIRTLDAAHGYTHDGGASFPLRGQGVGMIPSLGEVLAAFPEETLLIDFKSRWRREADLLSAYLTEQGVTDFSRFMVYGGAEPVERFVELHPEVRHFTRWQLRDCAIRYMALGWTGYVPEACRETVVLLPVSHTGLIWGWPRRFIERMEGVNTEVWLMGPFDGAPNARGLDDPELKARIPEGVRVGIWTNRIEIINPDTFENMER